MNEIADAYLDALCARLTDLQMSAAGAISAATDALVETARKSVHEMNFT